VRYPIPADVDTPCRHGDPERWFPRTGEQATAEAVAKECRPCPLLEDCRDWALYHEPDGLWGATTANERRAMRKRLGIIVAVPYMSVEGRFGERPRRPAPPPDHHQCGSLAGYSAHRRRREPVCDACQQAQHEYSAQHRPGRAS
jgi:WhiB family redox-sensing transcriptional regulator